jgi:outer membrane protein TolC
VIGVEFAVALAIIGFQEPVEVLTLDRAISIGVERSLGAKIAESQLVQAKERTKQARGLLGFRLDSQFSYDRYAERQTFGGGGSGGNFDSKRASIVLSYPVDIVGLSRKAALAAKKNEESVAESITITLNQTRFDIREAFFGVIRASWVLQVAEEAVKAAEARLSNANKFFNAGSIARFDVLRLETDLSRVNAELDQSQNNLRLAKQVLNNRMERDAETPFTIESEYLNTIANDLPKLETQEGWLLDAALQNRAELRQLSSALEARKFVTYTRRGGLSPSLNLSLTHSEFPGASSFQQSRTTTLNATVSFPLWDSGVTKAQIAEAKQDEVQIVTNLERTRLGISLQLKSAIVRFRNAEAQMRFSQKTVNLQTEALRLAELRFNAGEGILLDVTTADADLRSAQGALVAARAEYLIAYAALQNAVGIDNLVPPATTTTEIQVPK